MPASSGATWAQMRSRVSTDGTPRPAGAGVVKATSHPAPPARGVTVPGAAPAAPGAGAMVACQAAVPCPVTVSAAFSVTNRSIVVVPAGTAAEAEGIGGDHTTSSEPSRTSLVTVITARSVWAGPPPPPVIVHWPGLAG